MMEMCVDTLIHLYGQFLNRYLIKMPGYGQKNRADTP